MRLLAIAPCLALLACIPRDDAGVDEEASGQVAVAFDSGGELARLTQPLGVGRDLGTDPAAAVDLHLQQVRQQWLDLDRGLIKCIAANVVGNKLTVDFTNCRVLLFVRIDGRIEGTVSIETDNDLPVAVVTDVTLDLTLVGFASRQLSAGFTLRQPVTIGAPIDFTGFLNYDDSLGGMLRLSAEATWTVTGGDQPCTTLTGGAELSGASLGELDPIALSGNGITRCGDTCPTDGHVELSFGRGDLLAWDYTGSNKAQVRGPGGRRLTLGLSCAPR